MIYVIFDLIIVFAETMLFFEFCQWQLMAKFEKKKQFLSILYIGTVFVIRYYCTWLEIATLDMIMNVLIYLTMLLIVLMFYENRVLWKFWVYLVGLLIIAITELLAVVTAMFLMNKNIVYVQNERHLIISICCVVYPFVTTVLFNFLRKRKRMFSIPSYNRFPLICILLLDVVFMIVMTWFWHFSEELKMSYEEVLLLILVIAFCVIVFSFVIFFNMMRKSEEQAELKLRLQKSEMQLQLNDELSSVTDKLRSLRHDMNNHISILKGYIQYQAYDDLNQYLDSMCVDIQHANQYVVVEPAAFAILLNSKIAKAQKMGIEIKTEIHIAELKMNEKDIVTLIGNILENAIEATEKAEYKKVHFQIDVKKSMYEIQCRNTYRDVPKRKGNVFLTTKHNTEIHGIGMKNIHSVVEQYGGTIEFYIEDEFVVEAKIPVKN